jgi:hypothetical protein
MPNLAFTVGNLTGPIHLLSGQDEITLSGSVVIGFDPALIDNEKAIVILPEARQVSACLRLGALLEILCAARLLQIFSCGVCRLVL